MGAPPGTRTPNPRIKSPLLTSSIRAIYQHLCASTLARYWQPPEADCRPLTGATAWYRDIRADMEQTWKPYGLDHLERSSPQPYNWFTAVRGPAAREPLKRWIRSVTPAASGPRRRGPRIDRSYTRDSPPVSPLVMPEALSSSECTCGMRTSARSRRRRSTSVTGYWHPTGHRRSSQG